MSDKICLCTRRINHGQSEVWLGNGSTELTERRLIASNEVRNVVQRLCPDEFDAFYEELYARLNHVTSLDTPELSAVAAELKLR